MFTHYQTGLISVPMYGGFNEAKLEPYELLLFKIIEQAVRDLKQPEGIGKQNKATATLFFKSKYGTRVCDYFNIEPVLFLRQIKKYKTVRRKGYRII